MNFSSLLLDPRLVEFLDKEGYQDLSPIQERALPLILKNHASFIKAPTGSGKTLCYLLPILNDLNLDLDCQAIIVVPTSLLVDQLYQTIRSFAPYKACKIDVIKDGTSAKVEKYNGQIVLATPEQLLFNFKKINVSKVSRLVIDEGDMILFDGFEKQLLEIFNLGIKGSYYLFTASVDEHLNTLVRRYISADQMIDVENGEITSSNVSHYLIDIKNQDRLTALVRFLRIKKPYKAIVFVSKKSDIPALDTKLDSEGISHLTISGDLSKRDQKRIFKLFENGKFNLLIGTDIIARGFDAEDVTDVISLDLPYSLVYYFHRAGRTGRFNNKGNSYVFYNMDDTTKAKELLQKGVKFTFLTLKENELKTERTLSQVTKKPKMNNKYLEQEIKKNIYKLRTRKVKPNYKKKIKNAIERTKKRHKEDVIKSNISRRNTEEGTTFTYYREDNFTKNKKSKKR